MKADQGFLRSVLTLFSGTVIAQAVPFLLSPVIARLYSAEQFAVFGTLMAVFSILNVVAAGRYEMAVVVPGSDREGAHLVRGALVIAVMMGVLSFGAVLLFGSSTRLAHRLPGLADVAWVAAMLAFLAGLQVALQQWLLRRKRFDAVARVKVVQAVLITLATIAFGYAGLSKGLELGYLVGWSGFALVTTWWVVAREPLTGPADRAGTLTALRAYREWPLLNAWPALINTIASGMAVFYVAGRYDAEMAGQHNFARQYMLVPISMVSVALGQVLFVRCAERVREGRPLMPELKPVLWVLLALALVIASVVGSVGEPLFRWIFGERWAVAGELGRILIVGYAMQLVTSPFAVVLLALRKVRLTLVFPIVFALLLLVPLFTGPLSAFWFVALLAAIEVVAYAVQGAVVLRAVTLHDRSLPR